MKFFLSHSYMSSPVIHGPIGNGREAQILMSDGSYKSVSYHGYIYKTQSLAIPLSTFVKVRVHALCPKDNVGTCEPIGDGWHLVGLYVHSQRPGVFVLCDADSNPLAKFCPHGLAPANR